MYFTQYKTTDPYLNMNAYIVRKSLDKAVGRRHTSLDLTQALTSVSYREEKFKHFKI